MQNIINNITGVLLNKNHCFFLKRKSKKINEEILKSKSGKNGPVISKGIIKDKNKKISCF